MKVILIYPPRRYWPFINEQDNYLLPQWLVCLGAYLRKHQVDVKLIDCMPLRLGWRSLAQRIEEEKPDVVGVGESHALYSDEALRLLKIVKKSDSSITTVGGGIHFTNLAEEILKKHHYVDFIVRGEGEETFLELLKELNSPHKNFKKVRGLAFREGNNVIINPPRPLIDNLDELPIPAYDMVPMDKYGTSRYLFSPGGTTIHHSRGCTSRCSFCIWWTQMAERKQMKNGEILFPKWRTKSVERTLEEIDILYRKYNKKCLIFVDDSWNINPQWNESFADELIKRKYKLNWFAFMRVDCILRDLENGIFEKLVKSGLSHISIGIERVEDETVSEWKKNFSTRDTLKKCIQTIRDKFPQVFIQGTFIVGTRNETKDSMWAQFQFAKELKLDYPAFHPLTPVPGTEMWKIYREKKWLEITDFTKYDWTTPVVSSKYMSREEIEDTLVEMNLKYTTISWLLKGLLSPYKYKRRMYIWWTLVTIKVLLGMLRVKANPLKWENIVELKKPDWYDS